MRFSLFATLGFLLLAVAVIVAFVTGSSSDVHGESLAERRVQSSGESFLVTNEGNQQPSDFVSRSRRKRKERGLMVQKDTTSSAPVADRQTILAALKSSPTTLAAMRPVMSSNSPGVTSPSLSVPTDSEAPGNTLLTEGFLVSVESYRSTPEGNELQVHLSPSQAASSVSFGGGFTLEEEQFRTKWGWAAFDQVQQTAKYAPSR